jgi:outer membrane immunogenic protein
MLVGAASAASAQGSGDAVGTVGEPFTGAYAGPQIGAHEHHFYLNVTDAPGGQTKGPLLSRMGYRWRRIRRLRYSSGQSGASRHRSRGQRWRNNPVARFPDGTSYTQHPRYGFLATGKVGYLLSDRFLAYGTLGYGGHRYRLGGSALVENAREWGSSFTIGAGLEYRASDRVGVRLDFRHLDNQMSHLLIGVPIRF